jgi:hypothetical protein
MKLNKGLFELYKQLVEQIYIDKDLYKEVELTLWPSRLGKAYNNKVMIVGRASNGGNIYLDKNNLINKSDAMNELNKDYSKGLQWVYDLWGNNEYNSKYSTDYNTKKSAFWRLSKMLADKIIEADDFVIDKIAYSNLYKVSNYHEGNPSNKLLDVQFEICKKILQKEIELYKPEVIVFLTSWEWAKWFLEDLKNLKKKTKTQYVEFVGKLNNSTIIVAQHPQGKPEIEQFEEIIKELTSSLKLKLV